MKFKFWFDNVKELFSIHMLVLIFVWIPLFVLFWITDKIVDFNHYLADKCNKIDLWVAKQRIKRLL